jgi:CHASE3 domain sensor protein
LDVNEPSDEMLAVLREIRDTQREHLAEYRRVAEESLAGQRRALAGQETTLRLYRRVLVVGAVLVPVILFLLWYVLSLLARYRLTRSG